MIDITLHNESDVEQKVVYPLLTNRYPEGLGFSAEQVRTKESIRAFAIDKGSHKKRYHPDYVIIVSGLPTVIIEAKGPNEDVDDALREARLYAAEVNALYPADLNPVQLLVSTDGIRFLGSRWDTTDIEIDVSDNPLSSLSVEFEEIAEFLNPSTLKSRSNRLLENLTSRPYYKPTQLLGGTSVRNEEIGHNGFGQTLALEYRHIFNPQTRDERTYVVKNAYIASKRRERYIDPIDRVIRAARPPAESDANPISDTSSPSEVISQLENANALQHQVMLIVGNVGAGKSTFVDYLREVALPEELRRNTIWIHVDMNDAPVDQSRIYSWVSKQIVAEYRSQHPTIDFDNLDTIEKVFADEIRKFKKGPAKLLDGDSAEYRLRLSDYIAKLQDDVIFVAKCMTRYLGAERARVPIVVFDNCDKRIRDEQLLMFQVAQWIRSEFRCLVVLPLRDETYDNHRSEPPLDTALKDLVFRVEPPLFHSLLQRRIQLALTAMHIKTGGRTLQYHTPRGIRIEYPSSDQAYFLTTILRSVFEYNRFVRRTIVGLAGRDIRRALEIFLELCSSGHIHDSEILKIIKAQGNYTLPYHVVARVLLRQNRRFYSDRSSYLHNLFAASPEDSWPHYFIRLATLRWLNERVKTPGPRGLSGYFTVSQLVKDLVPLGIDENALYREMYTLLRAGCILAEHLRTDVISPDDLIRLGPSGSVHLNLVDNPDYLAAISEDTWYNDEARANSVAQNIADEERHYSRHTTFENADQFVEYMDEAITGTLIAPEAISKNPEWNSLLDFGHIKDRYIRNRTTERKGNPWLTVEERISVGAEVQATLKNKTNFGLFFTIEEGVDGLLHRDRLSFNIDEHDPYRIGANYLVKILSVDPKRERVSLAPGGEEE